MDNNKFIKINICLTDLDKSLIVDYQGKKYLLADVKERRSADPYGNTHSVSVRVKKQDGTFESVYIGKGKEAVFGGQSSQTNQAPATQAPQAAPLPPVGDMDEYSDLPF